MHGSQVQSGSIKSNSRGSSCGCSKPANLYLRQNLQVHSHSMMLLLVHNERFEVIVVKQVQFRDLPNNTVQAWYNEAALEFGNSIYSLFSACSGWLLCQGN